MLLSEALAWRARQAGPVVFTNGVFDLLHPGHVELLEAARREGSRAQSSASTATPRCAGWAKGRIGR